ncbi:tripartite motif-containing protein 42-like [Mytilus trossulus]|uniref:tripartite motif-containing protein 42-like n=1 Tax=Mytilus trossulus TaxID=6551 RepID=UPI003004E4D2
MATSNSAQIIQFPIGCQLCQSTNTIQWKCVNCQLLMCTSCIDNIHLRIAKHHSVIHIDDIGELDSGESFNFSDGLCNQHANQVCCSYCRTCKTVVCLKCVMTLHNGHEFVEEEEFLSKKKKIWEGNKNALKKLDDLYTTEAKLRKIKESEDTMYNKAKENIQNRATTDWEYWSKKLLELEVKKLSVNQGIERELRNLDREKEKFQEAINIVDVIKSSKDVCQFFEKFDEVITSLNCELVPFKSNFGSISDFVEGEYLESKLSQQKRNNSKEKNSFKVVNQYTTDIMSIHFLTELSDQTLLMSDSQSKVIQHVKLEVNTVQVISNFNIQIQGMTISPFGDILLST